MTSQTAGPTPEVFAEVARSLLAQEGVQRTLQRIVELAVDTIEGCDHAAISFIRGGKGVTPAATDDVARTVDVIQNETGEGPCLDAIRKHEVFRTGDLGRETRWRQFSARAQRETGITSMLSFRLFVAGDTLGAVNLYARAADAFDDMAVTTGSVFAAHAAIALSSSLRDEQMAQAIESRDVIGQAKGMLMAREGVDAEEAFWMLKRASQRLNVKLRDVAAELVAGGKTPGSAPPPVGEGGQGDA